MLKFDIVENGKLIQYERIGECNRCGECCQETIYFKWDVWSSSYSDAEPEDPWAEWEGWSIFSRFGATWGFKITEFEGKGEIEHRDCPSLKDGKCSIWHDPEEQPVLCRFWPICPGDLVKFPMCSYEFRRIGPRIKEEEEKDENGG